MSEPKRMTEEELQRLRLKDISNLESWEIRALRGEAIDARASEAEKDKALAEKDKVINALTEYIRTRAGHEEHCRGWRMVGNGHNRRERMEIEHCTCGPGALLRKAGALP